ncbi:hypothetical protein OY671_009847, partial [Metschnikowia pulcherrima]
DVYAEAKSVGYDAKIMRRVVRSRKMKPDDRRESEAQNATEREYGALLELRRVAGEVAWFKFEGLKSRRADNTCYTPDFAVMLHTGESECHEVKGFWQDDARAKIKIAADLYPFAFIAVRKRAKKDGGGFERETFS